MTPNSTIESCQESLQKATAQAGYVRIEAEVTTGHFDVSPGSRAMFGFSVDAATATVAELPSRMHPEDPPQTLGEVSRICFDGVPNTLKGGIRMSLGWVPRPGSAPTSWRSASEFVRR